VANVPPPETAGTYPRCLRTLGAGAAVVAATILAYLPSLSGRFIWNDSDYVTAPALRSLGGLARIWTDVGATQQYYPLLHSAFWLQHGLFGANPLGYHIVTLLLHAGSAVLFGLIVRKLLEGDREKSHYAGAGWLAALLFALHPVHVESVAWISEQKNTLSLAFYLGSALAYLGFADNRSAKSYALAAALFALSLLCKTVTATLPAALLVVVWWKRGRLEWRRDILPLVPWLALGAVAGKFSSWVERVYGGAQGADFDLPMIERPLVAGRAVWFYLGNLAWPANLDFIYPRWSVDAAVWWHWLFPLDMAGVAAMLWLVRRRTRGPLAAFLFFVGSLFPVLGFVNLYGARYSWVWDHWQYLADLGPIALAAAAATAAWHSARQRFAWAGWGGWGAVLAISVILGSMTWRHCRMFHDDTTLYLENIALNPGSWLAHDNLGVELEATPGRLNDAISEYNEALRLNPNFAEAHNNLGSAYSRIPGRISDAVAQFEAALSLKPEFVDARYNLANALGSEGRKDEAIAQYREALRTRPSYVEAHFNLANTLASMGRTQEAVGEFEEALRLKPDYAEAHNNLGLAFSRMDGRLNDAVEQYNDALRLRPDMAETHTNLGLALSGMPGRQDDAVAQYREALRLKPDYADAHFYLANALIQGGQVGEAVQQYRQALQIQPNLAEASNNLGMILCRTGRPGEGIGYIEAAIRAKPDFAQAHFARGAALLQLGRKDEALDEYQRVLQLRPGDPSVLRILEMLRAQP
jgi:tetratricopeptide (TPR) repeat protein